MKTINIGVLAHVDAGKTTLTERILLETGVIHRAGSVDEGNTKTDALEVEQARGITVKASAVSFALQDTKINVIDTPGHADFISEVEHSLGVLDGVILVISAVEGVQSQTKVLMHALREANMPTVLFINKIDRMGANYNKVIWDIRSTLTTVVCELNEVMHEGTKMASIVKKRDIKDAWIDPLSLHDERLLSDYIQDVPITDSRIYQVLCEQTKIGKAFPILVGSAVKGIGVQNLISRLVSFFPVNIPSDEVPLSGVVFKVTRNESGERVSYIRIYEGCINIRNHIAISRGKEHQSYQWKVKSLKALQQGEYATQTCIHAGDIAVIHGLPLQIGDIIGNHSNRIKEFSFQKPPIQMRIFPEDKNDIHALFEAMTNLTIEDPFIQFSQDDLSKEMTIKVFGDVQKEVIAMTLKDNYGIAVQFSEREIRCIEKPVSVGSAKAMIDDPTNPFWATVGFRIEPGKTGEGIQYQLEVELGSLPLSFQKAIEETVYDVLLEGLYGWNVTDMIVTLTHSGYASPVSAAGDFRDLVPLVLMEALQKAGTEVFEPFHDFQLRVPDASVSNALAQLSAMEAHFSLGTQYDVSKIEGIIPVRTTETFKRYLKSFTKGEGLFVSRPGDYYQVNGKYPEKKRNRINPLHRERYLMHKNKTI